MVVLMSDAVLSAQMTGLFPDFLVQLRKSHCWGWCKYVACVCGGGQGGQMFLETGVGKPSSGKCLRSDSRIDWVDTLLESN